MGIQERKARQFERRENEIIETAFDLFSMQHPATVTFEQLAQKCEIGRGTLYLHFQNKDEIYARIIIARNSQLLKIFQGLELETETAELLEKTVEAYVTYCLNDAPGYRVQKLCDQLLIKENLSEQVLHQLEELRNSRIELLSTIIRKGIDDGILRPVEPEMLLAAAYGMLYGAIDIILQGHFQTEIQDKKSYLRLVKQTFNRAFLVQGGGKL